MSFIRHFTVAEAIIQPKGKKMARDVVLSHKEGNPLFNPQESLIKHPEKTEVSRKEEHPK